jgi:predicted MFS family arabinose efflux permease
MPLYGFFISGPATSAYIVTFARKDRVTLTYTSMSASWWLGYIFSPGLGGYLSTLVGMQNVLIASFAFYAAATLTLLLIRSQRAERPVKPSDAQAKLGSSHVKPIILLSAFFGVVFFFLNLVRPLVVQFFQDAYGLDSLGIGLLGSIGFLGSAVFSVLLGKTGDKLGKMVATAIALLVGGFSFGLFISVNLFYGLAFASFLNGASYMLWSLMGASVGSIAPEASRGRWISLAQISATLAAATAPYMGGVLYEQSPLMPFYIIVAVSPFLSLISLTKLFKQKLGKAEIVTA